MRLAKYVFVSAVLFSAAPASAQLRTMFDCYSSEYGMHCSGGMNPAYPDTYEGAPWFSDLSIQELVAHTGGQVETFAMTPQLVTLRNNMQYIETSGAWGACQHYIQEYQLISSGKIAEVSIGLCSERNGFAGLESGLPRYEVRTQVAWPLGAPAQIGSRSTAGGVGYVVRSDHDPASGAQHSTMETVGSASLRPVEGGTRNVTPNVDLWDALWSPETQILARFAEPNGDYYAHNYDLLWRASDAGTQYWLMPCPYELAGHLSSENCYDHPEMPIQTVSYGGQNDDTHLPGFVNSGGGQDQVAYLIAYTPNPSQTNAVTTRSMLIAQHKKGKRSVRLRWTYYHSGHGNPDFKPFKDRQGVWRSVREALQSLVAFDPSNDLVINTKLDTRMTCSFVGDRNTACTIQELKAVENNGTDGLNEYSYARYNAGVYVLQNTSYLADYPTAASANLTRNPQDYTGGGLGSRAFVFPKNIANNNRLYFAIANRIGYTFGIPYSATGGGCIGFPCAGSDLVNYEMVQSTLTPVMEFAPSAKLWFQKAPVAWTHPRLGYGTYNTRGLPWPPDAIINW